MRRDTLLVEIIGISDALRGMNAWKRDDGVAAREDGGDARDQPPIGAARQQIIANDVRNHRAKVIRRAGEQGNRRPQEVDRPDDVSFRRAFFPLLLYCSTVLLLCFCFAKTERGGFEPPNGFKPVTAFPVLLLRPLGHLSRLGSGHANG